MIVSKMDLSYCEYHIRIDVVLAAHGFQRSAISFQLKKVWKREYRLVDIQ
jgi:hypothetical protein